MISFFPPPLPLHPAASRRQLWIEMADNKVSPLHYQRLLCYTTPSRITLLATPLPVVSPRENCFSTRNIRLNFSVLHYTTLHQTTFPSHCQYCSIKVTLHQEATFPLHTWSSIMFTTMLHQIILHNITSDYISIALHYKTYHYITDYISIALQR